MTGQTSLGSQLDEIDSDAVSGAVDGFYQSRLKILVAM